jgi:hypothetical protein
MDCRYESEVLTVHGGFEVHVKGVPYADPVMTFNPSLNRSSPMVLARSEAGEAGFQDCNMNLAWRIPSRHTSE